MGSLVLNGVNYTGGSKIEVVPKCSEGVLVADIIIDGESHEIYAPEGGSGGSDVRQMLIINNTGSRSTMSATGEVTS